MRLQNIKGFTLVEIMIVVCIIGLLVAIAIPSFMHAREHSRMNACFDNQRVLEQAKQLWSDEVAASQGDMCGSNDVAGYVKVLPTCPSGGDYVIGTGTSTCYCTFHDWRTIPKYSHFRP